MLFVAMVLTLSSFAYAEDFIENGYMYVISNGKAVIIDTSQITPSNHVEIPNTLGGLPVAAIKRFNPPFENNVETIKIPESVVEIGGYAFAHSSLISVTIPKNVKKIGLWAFYDSKRLTAVTIESGDMECLGATEFDYIEELYWGSSFYDSKYEFFKDNETNSFPVFSSCFSLAAVVIPESVTGINKYEFKTVDFLLSEPEIKEFPKRLTIYSNTGAYAESFAKQNNIDFKEIPLEKFEQKTENNYKYIVINGKAKIIEAMAGGNVEIPKTLGGFPVTVIGSLAFSELFHPGKRPDNALLSVKIPEGVEVIEYGAFSNCPDLKEVNISTTVKYIADFAFGQCQKLLSVLSLENVEELGDELFSGSLKIKNITLPKNLKIIPNNLFYNNEEIENIEIPEGVVEIGGYAFFRCRKITNIELPKSLTKIGDYAFWGTELSSVKLPEGLLEIGHEAFSASPLTEINFPSSLVKIGNNAFNRTNLKDIELPKDFNKIPGGFYSGMSIGNIEISEEITEIGDYAFISTNIKTITIPKTVKLVKEGAFQNCESLTTVIIEEGVETIEGSIFNNCKNLTTVVIPDSITSLDEQREFRNYQSGYRAMIEYTSIPETLTLYGNKDSYIEGFAKQNNIPFRRLIKASLNGENIKFDQPLIIKDGRTLVPLRAIFEALNANVDWDDKTKTITAKKEDIIISLQIGSNILNKNGEQIILDVPAMIFTERTLVPLRAVSECFGAAVNWDAETETVSISTL